MSGAIAVPTADEMHALGRQVAAKLQAGDLVVLIGELGAGKTTFAQGVGAGLGVHGDVVSPTFVITRVHSGKPPLVHVDAYRLGSVAEVDDLDIDTDLAASVLLVEWGGGLVEQLSGNRLEVTIERPTDPGDETRLVRIEGHGPRWAGVEFDT